MKSLISVYDRFLCLTGQIPGFLAGIMALGVAGEVVARNLGIGGFGWMVEAVEYGILAVAMIGTAHVFHAGGHVTVDIITAILPPALGRLLSIFAALLCLAVSGLLFFYGLSATIESFKTGATLFKSFTIKEWIPLASVPFAAFFLSVEAIRLILRIGSGEQVVQSHAEDL